MPVEEKHYTKPDQCNCQKPDECPPRNYSIKWFILKRPAAYTSGGNWRGLCWEEKLCILKANNSLNMRSEFYAKCCHKEKFSLCKFKPTLQDKPLHQRPTVDVDESNINWIKCLKIVFNKAWNLSHTWQKCIPKRQHASTSLIFILFLQHFP